MVDFELRTGKMSFLEFEQNNTLVRKTDYSMFPLRVIGEPKMSETNLSLCRPWVDLFGKPILKFLRTNDERGDEWQLLKIECTFIQFF